MGAGLRPDTQHFLRHHRRFGIVRIGGGVVLGAAAEHDRQIALPGLAQPGLDPPQAGGVEPVVLAVALPTGTQHHHRARARTGLLGR